MLEFLLIAGSIILIIFIIIIFKSLLKERSLERIEKHIKEKNYRYATTFLSKVIKKDPQNVIALWYLAKCYEAMGKNKEALPILRRIGKSPYAFKEIKEGDYHLLLGNVLYKLDRKDEAINEFLLVTQYSPANSFAYYMAGKLFFEKRDNDTALKFLLKAITINKNDYKSHLLVGRIFYYIGLLNKAHTYITNSIHINKNCYIAYYYLALIEFKRGNYTKAIDYAEVALKDEASEKRLKILFLIGNSYEKLDDINNAIKYYEILSEETPLSHPLKKEVYYHLAINYEKMNQTINAMLIWKRLYYMAPTYKDVSERYLKYSSIENEEIIRKIIEASESEILKWVDKILKKLALEKISHNFVSANVIEINASEISSKFSTSVLIHFNRNLDIVDVGILESFFERLKLMNCKRGIYICITEFTSKAISFSSRYAIDLIPRKQLLKLLRSNV